MARRYFARARSTFRRRRRAPRRAASPRRRAGWTFDKTMRLVAGTLGAGILLEPAIGSVADGIAAKKDVTLVVGEAIRAMRTQTTASRFFAAVAPSAAAEGAIGLRKLVKRGTNGLANAIGGV